MTAFWNRSPEFIVEQWNGQLAHGIEAGEEPVFNLGISDTTLEGLLGVTAAQRLALSVEVTTLPTLVMGGGSPLWLVLLWPPPLDSPLDSAPRSDAGDTDVDLRDDLDVVYGGADMVTQIASASTLAPVSSALFAAPAQRQTGLALPLRWLFAPGVEPGATLLWRALPFAMHPIVQAQMPVARPEFRIQPTVPAVSEQTTWLAWTALFVVAVLLLATVFV